MPPRPIPCLCSPSQAFHNTKLWWQWWHFKSCQYLTKYWEKTSFFSGYTGLGDSQSLGDRHRGIWLWAPTWLCYCNSKPPRFLPSPVIPATSLKYLPIFLECSISQQILPFFTAVPNSAVSALFAFSQNQRVCTPAHPKQIQFFQITLNCLTLKWPQTFKAPWGSLCVGTY